MSNKKNKIVDYWYCPNCGFRVLDFQYQLIKNNRFCRCGAVTGITWKEFLPKIKNDLQK